MNATHSSGAPKKRAAKNKSRDNLRPLVEDILRSIADDQVERAPKRDTLIKRTEISNMRHSITNLESSVTSQFLQVDYKLNTLKGMIDDMQLNINKKNEHWENELRSCIASVSEMQEKDKAKTLKTLQKMHSQHEADIKDTRAAVGEVQKVSIESLQHLKETMKSLAKEVSRNKDEIIAMKKQAHDTQLATAVAESMKQPADFYNYGVDASITLDHIARRVKALEFRVADAQESAAVGHAGGFSGSAMSPSGGRYRSSHRAMSTPGTVTSNGHNILGSGGQRRADVEEHHFELDEKVGRLDKRQKSLCSRIEGNERAIKEITQHITSIRAVWDSSSNRGGLAAQDDRGYRNDKRPCGSNIRDGGVGADCSKLNSDCIVLKEKQRNILAKLKALSTGVSRSCRSLSVGVSDSQHATLLLYSWAEKVHSAFREVSILLSMEENPCPRPQIHDPSQSDCVFDVTSYLPNIDET